jgi:hypothetical protein
LTCPSTRHLASLRILVFCFLLVFLFSGLLACDKQQVVITASVTVPTEPSTSVVTRYFEALQRNDYAAANACLDGGTQNVFAMNGSSGSPLDTFYTQLLRRLKFEVQAETLLSKTASSASTTARVVAGSTDNVSVKVTAMNVPVLFDETMGKLSKAYADSLVNATPIPEAALEARLYEMLADSMSAENAPRLSGTLLIRVVYTGGEWRIITDSTLYNAVTGNFLQFLNMVPYGEPLGINPYKKRPRLILTVGVDYFTIRLGDRLATDN